MRFFASDSTQGGKRAIIITVKGTHTLHISSYFLSNFFVVPVFLYFSVHTAPVSAGAVFFCENDRETAERFDKIKSGDDFTVD